MTNRAVSRGTEANKRWSSRLRTSTVSLTQNEAAALYSIGGAQTTGSAQGRPPWISSEQIHAARRGSLCRCSGGVARCAD